MSTHRVSPRFRRLGFLIVSIVLALTMPAFAEPSGDDRGEVQHRDHHESGPNAALKDRLKGLTRFGPAGTPLPPGAQRVELNQALALLNGGTVVPYTPMADRGGEREVDSRRRDRDDVSTFEADRVHERVVKDYLTQHPELVNLARLVNSEPSPDAGAAPNGDGTWTIHPAGVSHPVTTLGRSSKLSWVYDSILFSDSRVAQLELYTSVYDKLQNLAPPATIGGVVGSVGTGTGLLPTPTSLADASLATIGAALLQIGRNWTSIVGLVPINIPAPLLGCDAEIGATPRTTDLYGDRSGSAASCGPIPGGLYATINFANKSYPTCVKDQGRRGTCHSFGVTSATEYMYSLTQGVKVNLSEQDLLEHYRFVWNRAIYDDAGDPWEEINSLMSANYVFPFEHQWDYNPSYARDTSTTPFTHSCDNVPGGKPCSDTSPQSPAVCFDFLGSMWCFLYEAGIHGAKYQPTAVTYFWNGADPELSTEYMVLELAFNNAVVMSFTVSPGFESPNNGFVTYDPADLAQKPLGGHVMHVVSFISNQDLQQVLPNAPAGSGGGYFIVKNSWSSCFADGGYVYLPWDYVKAEVGQAFAVSNVN